MYREEYYQKIVAERDYLVQKHNELGRHLAIAPPRVLRKQPLRVYKKQLQIMGDYLSALNELLAVLERCRITYAALCVIKGDKSHFQGSA